MGGWVEFYRSPARRLWTPTGVNAPEYGTPAQVWPHVPKGALRTWTAAAPKT